MKVRGGNPRIVTNGLVLHFDAQNPRSYPGTGTKVWDISGNSFNGTLTTAGIGTTTSNIFTFTDAGEYISFSDPLSQAATVQQWTVQAWVKLGATGETNDFLQSWNLGLQWERSTTDKPLNYLNSGDNDSYVYGNLGDFQSGDWTFGTFTLDRVNNTPGRVTIQEDLNSPTVGSNVGSGDVPVGIGSTIKYGANMTGDMRNLLIYNRELTTAEITQNYNSQKTRYGI